MKLIDRALKTEEKEEPRVEEGIEETADIEENTLNLGWYFSENKNEYQVAKIREKDRATHFYVVGASGSGKSKLLEFLIRQDIYKRNGFGIIDPHGDLVEDIKGYLALALTEEEIEERVTLIDPTDPKYTVAFNPLEKIEGISSAEISAELVEAFKKIWGAEGSYQVLGWGARMEDLLRNSFIALIEAELTLVDLPLFLTDEDFRLNALEKVTHPIALQYFKRFNNLSPKTRDEWMESTLNKVNAFLSDDRIREMFSFKKSSFSLREMMDDQKILLLKLDRGRLKENADLIGSLFMTKIRMAAFSRSDIPKEKRLPFFLFVDEFQNFATESFIETLGEARKYALSLIMAHQNLSQLPRNLQDSILTNCGIQVYFRVSRRDAEILAREAFETTGTEVKALKLSPELFDYDYYSYPEEWERYLQDLQSLPARVCYVKHKLEGGIIPISTAEVEPPYMELGIDQKEHQVLLDKCQFGKKYLLERRGWEREKELVKDKGIIKTEEKPVFKAKEEKPRTLEEIIALMDYLDKAILWAIGTGNYYASDIFEEANKKLKLMGASTRHYSEFKKKFYELSKLPPEGKGLVEFTKRGRSFCYWLSQWGEIAFAEKFDMPSDRAINELGGGGKLSRSVALEIIKEWLEPEGYKVRKEDEIETDLSESHRGYTDLVAEKDGEEVRIEIEHRSTKEQIEKNIRKNLEYSNVIYEIASDEVAKKKIIQVALKTIFRLRKEKPDKDLRVKIASIDELKQSKFHDWFEVKI
ncbi:MAG: type IV secretion system DNA-binding domain-containing protein [Methanocellales archaeon]|nr:type IV secretion system DNA-binding domain-containing protein [Methanocellales archaeon]MDD3292098.1 type IV secretion system DNA-binding domain-containing protein [Methanocellales archaeon]MDD5235335.1 type IV secretion system DNA-binding domain-containing protein [Methanocellales archaeon]MDD5485717.1 type IV secretion system DNA-binding domain-containing protein [Methanocellales archaeon]